MTLMMTYIFFLMRKIIYQRKNTFHLHLQIHPQSLSSTKEVNYDHILKCSLQLGKASKKKKSENFRKGGGGQAHFGQVFFFSIHVLNHANLQRKIFFRGGGVPLRWLTLRKISSVSHLRGHFCEFSKYFFSVYQGKINQTGVDKVKRKILQ